MNDASAQLSDLVEVLSEESQKKVLVVATGVRARCTSEITTFALRHVLDIQPTSRCSDAVARHFFVDSQCTTVELNRYKKFRAEQDAVCQNRFERAAYPAFEFSYRAVKGSLFALQERMRARGVSSIANDAGVDVIYFPLYDEPAFAGDPTTHCSMLVYLVRRDQLVLFDSIRTSQHHGLAQQVLSMLNAARLVVPGKTELRLPLTRQQHGATECGWCALIFARWWRSHAQAETNIEDVLNVRIDEADVSAFACDILRCQLQSKEVSLYADRLQRAFFPLRDRASNLQAIPVTVERSV